LVTLFDLIGILGGWVSGCLLLGVNSGSYFYRVVASTMLEDVTGGLIKSLVFGILVVTICCFQGFFTHMRTDSFGARSVSLSTTSAVVLSCVMILVSDYVVTAFVMS
jgi:phospholipid/cholesterol/gamma-HCH transport system permease protein